MILKQSRSILFFFFTIFSFRVPFFNFNHSYIIFMIIMLLFYMINNRSRRDLICKYNSIYFVRPLFFVFLSASVVLFALLVHNEPEQLQYFKQLLLTFICLLFLPVIFLFIDRNKIDLNLFIKYIIFAFTIQSFIQILAFSFPDVRDVVHMTYDALTIEKSKEYGFLRAIALYNDPFFSLACLYAFSFMLMSLFFYLNNGKLSLIFVISCLLIWLGSFFSGRTALIGVFFSGFFLFLTSRMLFLNLLFKSFFILIVAIILFIVVAPESMIFTIRDVIIPRAFSFVYAYMETGDPNTASTSNLIRMLSANIDEMTFLYGDGKYTTIIGTYYMDNDSGYFRNIFYFGVILSLVVYALFIASILPIKKSVNIYFLFIIMFLSLIFTLQIKGMVIFTNIPLFILIQSLLYMFSKEYINKKSYKVEGECFQ